MNNEELDKYVDGLADGALSDELGLEDEFSDAELEEAILLATKISEAAKRSDKDNRSTDNRNQTVPKKRNSKKGWLVLLICMAALLIGTSIYIVYYFASNKRSADSIEEMRNKVRSDYKYNDEDYISGAANVVIPVDIEELKKINPDIYAWLYIPGTEVDYPVLQSENDGYYLNHDSEGNRSATGAIYSENLNGKEFEDFNTVIYGHNMKNGSMFGNLHSYEDPDFFDGHRTIYVYTSSHIIKYTVFAAYRYDDRHILESFDFNDENVKKKYIDYIFEMKNLYSTVKNDQNVDIDSNILTLSTCCGDDDERWLVQAVMVDKKASLP